METKGQIYEVRIEPSDWRWSATIVGLVKYFKEYDISYLEDEDYIEFNNSDITEEKYLEFVEVYFKEKMHHKIVEDLLEEFYEDEKNEEKRIKDINAKILGGIHSNTIMKNTFKNVKYTGENNEEIKKVISINRYNLIKETYKNGGSLYKNFCNENVIFKDKENVCRIKGYNEDMSRKGKSISYRMNLSTFVYQDSKLFDFIPFAFSKTRESFFINNNFTIKNLIKSNNSDYIDDKENLIRSELFFKSKKSSLYIDYDVEVIYKEREKDYFQSLYVRKSGIKIFDKISEKTQEIISRPCKINQNWIQIQIEVTNSIINEIKLDNLIEKLFKEEDKQYLISHLIKINILIYQKGDDEMTEKQKQAYAAAKQVKSALEKNKVRAYEKRLISAISMKDYEKVQDLLLHLSSNTQVKIGILYDLFEDFEKNKNLAYTFINALIENNNGGKNDE